MKFGPGRISLSDINGGVLSAGVVPWPRLTQDGVINANSGLVTLTGLPTSIFVGSPLNNLAAQDRIIANVKVTVTKGGTTGLTSVRLRQSAGTATVRWESTATEVQNVETAQPNGSVWICTFTVIGYANVGGSSTFEVDGISAGSNGTVAVGDGQLALYVFRNS